MQAKFWVFKKLKISTGLLFTILWVVCITPAAYSADRLSPDILEQIKIQIDDKNVEQHRSVDVCAINPKICNPDSEDGAENRIQLINEQLL